MKKAFSLIELLVVIAIVSVLAAIAVPMYQKYSIRSKIQSIQPVLNSIFTQIRQYLDTHNADVTGALLGYPAYTGTAISGFTNSFSINPPPGTGNVMIYMDIHNFFLCNLPGRVAQIVVGYDMYKLGLSSTPNTAARVVYFIYRVNNQWVQRCVNFEPLPDGVLTQCTDVWGTVTTEVTQGNPGCV